MTLRQTTLCSGALATRTLTTSALTLSHTTRSSALTSLSTRALSTAALTGTLSTGSLSLLRQSRTLALSTRTSTLSTSATATLTASTALTLTTLGHLSAAASTTASATRSASTWRCILNKHNAFFLSILVPSCRNHLHNCRLRTRQIVYFAWIVLQVVEFPLAGTERASVMNSFVVAHEHRSSSVQLPTDRFGVRVYTVVCVKQIRE